MIIIFFIFGLLVGSFLNAVIYRLNDGKPIVAGRSQCPHCHHNLSAVDLVPLFSFILLRGKCRYCHKKISLQYPAVELLTAISFTLLAANYNLQPTNPVFWFDLVFISIFIVIAVFDLKHYLILDKVVFPAIALALILNIILTLTRHENLFGWHSIFIQGLLGVVIISGFFGLQYIFSAGKWIGLGDVKLGILLGLIFGLGQGLMLLMISYAAGAVVGLLLIASGRKQLSSKLPFGTFLAFCGIIMLLYGPAFVSWYLKLLGF